MNEIEIEPPNYFSPQYCHPGRMASYGYQIRETLNCKPKNLLEIGIGNGVVAYVIKNFGVSVTTLDTNRELKPDIVGSVIDMPLPDQSFDLVICCEILEHLHYDEFESALAEIHRVTRRFLILSLPDSTRYYRVEFRLPKIRCKYSRDVPFRKPKKHEFDGEHYWEIGKAGYSLDKICNSIAKTGFSIEKTYRIWENPYHRMFVAYKNIV